MPSAKNGSLMGVHLIPIPASKGAIPCEYFDMGKKGADTTKLAKRHFPRIFHIFLLKWLKFIFSSDICKLVFCTEQKGKIQSATE